MPPPCAHAPQLQASSSAGLLTALCFGFIQDSSNAATELLAAAAAGDLSTVQHLVGQDVNLVSCTDEVSLLHALQFYCILLRSITARIIRVRDVLSRRVSSTYVFF
jgi:hypothetical protein